VVGGELHGLAAGATQHDARVTVAGHGDRFGPDSKRRPPRASSSRRRQLRPSLRPLPCVVAGRVRNPSVQMGRERAAVRWVACGGGVPGEDTRDARGEVERLRAGDCEDD
jgi:hypothetical protein